MTESVQFVIDGRNLKDGSGDTIMCLSDGLSENDVKKYGSLFAASLDMLAMLEDIFNEKLKEWQEACKDAAEYNNRFDVPSLRPLAEYQNVPESLGRGLALISKAKGRG